MSSLASICNDVFKFREEHRLMFNDGRNVKQLAVTPFRNQADDVMGVVATVVDDISTGTMIDLLQSFGNNGRWHLDLVENKLFWWDEVFRIHGMKPEDIIPEVDKAIEFYHPDDRTAVAEGLQECIETGVSFQFTLRLQQASGRVVVVEFAATRFLDEKG